MRVAVNFFCVLKERGRFTEDEARFCCAELVYVIEKLHLKGIVHRDLKPENILLDDEGHVVLTDFGLSKPNVNDGDVLLTVCGTPYYLAPEILMKKPYTKEVDWWCIGILLHEMLVGLPPFLGVNHHDLYAKILKGKIEFKKHLSSSAKDLITKILKKKPEERLKPDEIKAHPFFKSIDWNRIANKSLPSPFIKEQIEVPDEEEVHSLKSSNQKSDNSNSKKSNEKKDVVVTAEVLKPEEQDAFRGFTWSLQPAEKDALLTNSLDDSFVFNSSRSGINPQEYEAEIAAQLSEKRQLEAAAAMGQKVELPTEEGHVNTDGESDRGRLHSFRKDEHPSATENDLPHLPNFVQSPKEEQIKK